MNAMTKPDAVLTDAECDAIRKLWSYGFDNSYNALIRVAFAAGAASVPREPTSQMEMAGSNALFATYHAPGLDQALACWRAMHDAATGESK